MIIIKKYNLILKFSAINVVSVNLIRVQSYYVLKRQLDMLIMFHSCVPIVMHGFLVSKETVVLHRWGLRSKQKFGFIKRVDKC